MSYDWKGIHKDLKQIEKDFEAAEKSGNGALLYFLHASLAEYGQRITKAAEQDAGLTRGNVLVQIRELRGKKRR